MNEEIRLLERVCLQIYTTPSADERKQAETVILNLADDPECLRKCQLLLDQARFQLEIFRPVFLFRKVSGTVLSRNYLFKPGKSPVTICSIVRRYHLDETYL